MFCESKGFFGQGFVELIAVASCFSTFFMKIEYFSIFHQKGKYQTYVYKGIYIFLLCQFLKMKNDVKKTYANFEPGICQTFFLFEKYESY